MGLLRASKRLMHRRITRTCLEAWAFFVLFNVEMRFSVA